MKNISRRVFIKGMAVAAVATAASTVLTGCKLPTGVDEPVVEAPTNSKVMTFTNPDKDGETITLTFGDLIKGNADFASEDEYKAVIKVNVNSTFSKDISVNPSTFPAKGDYYFKAECYYNGLANNEVNVADSGLGATSGYTITAGQSVVAALTLEDLKAPITSITVKVTMYESVDNTNELGAKIGDAKEVTYTL